MNWSHRCANRTGDGPVGRSFLSSVAVLMLGGMMAGGCSDGSGSSAPEEAAPAVSVPLPPTAPAASTARVSPPANAAAVPVPPEASTQSPANKTGKNKIKLEPILGRTTQEIHDAPTQRAAGAKSVKPRVTARGPIRIVGNTYMVIIGRAAQLQIKHAIDLYHASTERYPKDLEELRNNVLIPNRIRLPKLPRYQEYGYDAQTHELLIFEYPDRKR